MVLSLFYLFLQRAITYIARINCVTSSFPLKIGFNFFMQLALPDVPIVLCANG